MSAHTKTVLTVSELNQSTQRLLEECFPAVWVEGEISNLVRPTSGHIYFSLKDPKAQIRCAMFRLKSQRVDFELRNGLLIQVLAKVSLYPDRGDYQLIVDRVEMAGDGLLKKAYEELVLKLTKEGLFEERWKKAIPLLPKQIGVVTSPTGAAIRDILSVLKRRFPSIPVIVYPTKVQGAEAMQEIVRAITRANQHQAANVLILARGGGSLEDLWPFNEERVARAIFDSQIPIVTGIGHEIDFTIADFVADQRAPTPSAAAELVVPDQNVFLQQLSVLENRLINEITKYCQRLAQRLDGLIKQIRHPGQQIENQLQMVSVLITRLKSGMQQFLTTKALALKNAMRALDTVSPLATLNRGYAILALQENNQVVRSIDEVQPGDKVQVRLQDGILKAEIL
jgi:exodeoxyribonuclease VII large subunit